jgi:hypothetical protein|tara:strand:- start:81 stop:482 length:402 start_codon:yes stop_codon:yes gene_type:complete
MTRKVDPLVAVIPKSFDLDQRRWLRYFQKVVYDLWLRTGGSADNISVKQVDTAVDYTTTGDFFHEVVNCTNTTTITVTLQDRVADAQVSIIRGGVGGVTIDGNGETMDGEATQVLQRQYDRADLIATSAEWVA